MQARIMRLIATLVFTQCLSLHAASTVADPEAFVREVYRHFSANESGYSPPSDIYTPRLKALFVRDERWAKGEVGCLDLDFWVNGQDWELKNVRITSSDAKGRPDRRTIIANFLNIGQANEIHFEFQNIQGKWLLDEVRCVRGGVWTLSKLLNCPH
jgi:hypothetical protein